MVDEETQGPPQEKMNEGICPKCRLPGHLIITGTGYVAQVTCMGCGANWPANRFNEEYAAFMQKENSIPSKIKKAIVPKKSNKPVRRKKATPNKKFCEYCGSKLVNGQCQKKCRSK